MRVRAAEKNLSFTVEYIGAIPSRIRSDPTRLRQILINLVSNAIKFTDAGGVRIGVRLLADSPVPALRFEVVDTGIGISEEQLQRIFAAFEQADGSTTRRFGGTGLGLAISKHLAELLGGDIDVESAPGRGSRFGFAVETGPLDGVPMLDGPREAEAAESHATPLQWRLKGTILLAEDGPDNQALISAYLRRAGCEVVIASNGRIACEKAMQALETGHPFDVILMDMQMPELDGYGAAARLRSKGYAGVIVALTAHAMAEDRRKCLQSGCTDYLTKPITRQALLESVARHLEPGAAQTESIQSSTDDEDLRQFLPKFIERLPLQVARLVELVARRDLDELAKLIHQLKGTGGLYGFNMISVSAARAEQAVKQAEPTGWVAGEVDELISIIRRVEGYDRGKEALASASAA
jgi:CheY-like chemotaxis protein/HPt (histidine-containing phosphotransfer) domain-containing protein